MSAEQRYGFSSVNAMTLVYRSTEQWAEGHLFATVDILTNVVPLHRIVGSAPSEGIWLWTSQTIYEWIGTVTEEGFDLKNVGIVALIIGAVVLVSGLAGVILTLMS